MTLADHTAVSQVPHPVGERALNPANALSDTPGTPLATPVVMSITRQQGIMTWAGRWRTLAAWRRDLSEVEVEVSDRAFPSRLGTCWTHQQRLVVYRSGSMATDLAVLLHELAHAATIEDSGHGMAWQAVYAAAVTEVTGIPVTPCADNYRVMDEAARDAVRQWWHASGNAFAWKLLQVSRCST